MGGKEVAVPKNSRRRPVWSGITKRYAWHTYTHISTHKGQSGPQGHVMLGFMSGTEVRVTHTREGNTPSWKTERAHEDSQRWLLCKAEIYWRPFFPSIHFDWSFCGGKSTGVINNINDRSLSHSSVSVSLSSATVSQHEHQQEPRQMKWSHH